jgi:4-hydroxythreonine-4-phosphate dehydrogenase
MIPRILLTQGEPAGIGPDLCVAISQMSLDAEIAVIGDPDLILARAEELGVALHCRELEREDAPTPHRSGTLSILPCRVETPVEAGKLNPKNAPFVLKTLDLALELCQQNRFDAMVTLPVHKGVINEAGIPFTGHTEYLADQLNVALPVMMLATTGLRVALATTHLPLKAVSEAITPALLREVITTLHRDLIRLFGLSSPHIVVCGLNPHAGEGGHLGDEELRVIEPLLDELRQEGLHLTGPIPADTAFTPLYMNSCDAFLAMYHDQGLPVLKHVGFGHAVNITLGLPIIRTSVDHGTALSLAGTGKIETGSLHYAIETAILCSQHRLQRASS